MILRNSEGNEDRLHSGCSHELGNRALVLEPAAVSAQAPTVTVTQQVSSPRWTRLPQTQKRGPR